MTERPLSPKMKAVLVAIDELRGGDDEHAYPATPNAIASECGFQPGMAKSGRSGRGHGSRVMGVAVHVNTALTALRKRGLVYLSRRPDGWSGSAYGLTGEGETEAGWARLAGASPGDASKGRETRF